MVQEKVGCPTERLVVTAVREHIIRKLIPDNEEFDDFKHYTVFIYEAPAVYKHLVQVLVKKQESTSYSHNKIVSFSRLLFLSDE
jgi:hypothetical protein